MPHTCAEDERLTRHEAIPLKFVHLSLAQQEAA
jgi:hypothetical protein